MCATNSFLKSLGVEIYASGHRRWPDEAKALAVAMTLEAGATVNAVAERFGCQSARNLDPLSACKNDPPAVPSGSWPDAV